MNRRVTQQGRIEDIGRTDRQRLRCLLQEKQLIISSCMNRWCTNHKIILYLLCPAGSTVDGNGYRNHPRAVFKAHTVIFGNDHHRHYSILPYIQAQCLRTAQPWSTNWVFHVKRGCTAKSRRAQSSALCHPPICHRSCAEHIARGDQNLKKLFPGQPQSSRDQTLLRSANNNVCSAP